MIPFSPSNQVARCPVGFVNLSNDPAAPECIGFVLNTGTWQQTNYMCSMIKSNMSKITGDLHHRLYNYIQETPGNKLLIRRSGREAKWSIDNIREP